MSQAGGRGTDYGADPAKVKIVRMLALAIGVIYTLIGVLGFFVTGFENFAEETGDTLLGFEVNPLHNIVHLVIGIAGIALSRTLATARTFGWLLVIGYGLVFIYGLFAVGNSDINFLSLNVADNFLHIGSVIAGLVIALLPVRDKSAATTTPDRR